MESPSWQEGVHETVAHADSDCFPIGELRQKLHKRIFLAFSYRSHVYVDSPVDAIRLELHMNSSSSKRSGFLKFPCLISHRIYKSTRTNSQNGMTSTLGTVPLQSQTALSSPRMSAADALSSLSITHSITCTQPHSFHAASHACHFPLHFTTPSRP